VPSAGGNTGERPATGVQDVVQIVGVDLRVVLDQPLRCFERGVPVALVIDRRIQQADEDLQLGEARDALGRHGLFGHARLRRQPPHGSPAAPGCKPVQA
jgi:hypothetical protein